MRVLAVTGGMVSVAYTDEISAFIFISGLLAAIQLLAGQIDGGVFGMFQNLPEGKNSFMGSLTIMQVLGLYVFDLFTGKHAAARQTLRNCSHFCRCAGQTGA